MSDYYDEEYFKRAETIFDIYHRSADKNQFIAAIDLLDYSVDDIDFLFALCNAAYHGGYIQGCEERENYGTDDA